MNERIEGLAEKAGIHIVPEPFDVASRAWNATMQDFANLLINECIDLALGSSHRDDDMGAIIANKIKKHFGVE